MCSFPDCVNPYRSKGYCDAHYQRLRKYGHPGGGAPMRAKAAGVVCTVDNCTRPVRCLELCRVHYDRLSNHGRLNLLSDNERFWARIKLGPVPDVAPELGECWIWTGAQHAAGYGKGLFGGRYESTHRYAYETLRVEIPEGLHLDHLCRVRACCNPWHLEPVTHAENVRRGLPYRTKRADAAS